VFNWIKTKVKEINNKVKKLIYGKDKPCYAEREDLTSIIAICESLCLMVGACFKIRSYESPYQNNSMVNSVLQLGGCMFAGLVLGVMSFEIKRYSKDLDISKKECREERYEPSRKKTREIFFKVHKQDEQIFKVHKQDEQIKDNHKEFIMSPK
jgi:hypothetical protein